MHGNPKASVCPEFERRKNVLPPNQCGQQPDLFMMSAYQSNEQPNFPDGFGPQQMNIPYFVPEMPQYQGNMSGYAPMSTEYQRSISGQPPPMSQCQRPMSGQPQMPMYQGNMMGYAPMSQYQQRPMSGQPAMPQYQRPMSGMSEYQRKYGGDLAMPQYQGYENDFYHEFEGNQWPEPPFPTDFPPNFQQFNQPYMIAGDTGLLNNQQNGPNSGKVQDDSPNTPCSAKLAQVQKKRNPCSDKLPQPKKTPGAQTIQPVINPADFGRITIIPVFSTPKEATPEPIPTSTPGKCPFTTPPAASIPSTCPGTNKAPIYGNKRGPCIPRDIVPPKPGGEKCSAGIVEPTSNNKSDAVVLGSATVVPIGGQTKAPEMQNSPMFPPMSEFDPRMYPGFPSNPNEDQFANALFMMIAENQGYQPNGFQESPQQRPCSSQQRPSSSQQRPCSSQRRNAVAVPRFPPAPNQMSTIMTKAKLHDICYPRPESELYTGYSGCKLKLPPPYYEKPDPCTGGDGYVHGQLAFSEFQCPEAQPCFECGKNHHLIAKFPELDPNFKCQMNKAASKECPDFKPKPKRQPCNMTCFPPDTYFYEEKIRKPKPPQEPAYLTCYKIEYGCDASKGAMKVLRDKTKKIPPPPNGPLQRFVPTYEKTEKKPILCRILSYDYQKAWLEERDDLKNKMYPKAPIPMYNIRLIPCRSVEESRAQRVLRYKKKKKVWNATF